MSATGYSAGQALAGWAIEAFGLTSRASCAWWAMSSSVTSDQPSLIKALHVTGFLVEPGPMVQ